MIYAIYFSPTGTTRAVVRQIAQAIGSEVTELDLSRRDVQPLCLGSEDVAVVGVPVYGGRLPALAAERVRAITGSGRAVAVAVYGNRHYDDALVELADLLTEGGLSVIAGGAFIAQHSIAPVTGVGRPDAQDEAEIAAFGAAVKQGLTQPAGTLHLPGNRPYKENKPAGFPIACTEDCIACGVCSAGCPAGAIDPATPQETDGDLCIRCMRCIHDCPTDARHLPAEVYNDVAGFLSSLTERRENEVFYQQA